MKSPKIEVLDVFSTPSLFAGSPTAVDRARTSGEFWWTLTVSNGALSHLNVSPKRRMGQLHPRRGS